MSQSITISPTVIWLVVSNIWIIVHFIYGIIPTPLTNSYFSEGLAQPPTSYVISPYIAYVNEATMESGALGAEPLDRGLGVSGLL